MPLSEIDNVPPLLSLICEQLNALRIREGHETLEPDSVTCSAKEVLRNFCDSSFQENPPCVREFVENRLVSQSGFRESVNFDTAVAELREADVANPEDILSELVNRRMLTIEDRGGVSRVELTHDILAPIIRKGRDAGLTEERLRQAQSLFDSLGAPDSQRQERLQWLASRLFRSISYQTADGFHQRRTPRITIDQVVNEALGESATEADLTDLIAVIKPFQAEGFLTLFPSALIKGETRVEVTSASLLRQLSRILVWIDEEAKSALQYRRLRGEVESKTEFLTDTHLDQALEWIAREKPNLFWAMRYDGREDG